LRRTVALVTLSNNQQRMMAKILPVMLAVALVTSASAADTRTTPANPATSATTTKQLPKRYPYHANVAAIDVNAKTITLDGKKKQRVLHITPATRILKDKKPVALETVKVGEYITGSLVDIEGHLEPTTVNVGGTTPKQSAQAIPPQAASPPQQSASIKATKPNGSTARKP
jgi:pyruvate/2-oxoglutarate dehydrogenase complex dihydrolipoamide acyltransferase (E2) component